jgi:hypothetical protein
MSKLVVVGPRVSPPERRNIDAADDISALPAVSALSLLEGGPKGEPFLLSSVSASNHY